MIVIENTSSRPITFSRIELWESPFHSVARYSSCYLGFLSEKIYNSKYDAKDIYSTPFPICVATGTSVVCYLLFEFPLLMHATGSTPLILKFHSPCHKAVEMPLSLPDQSHPLQQNTSYKLPPDSIDY